MTLKLYLHPLASYCWKALIAFYENGVSFEPIVVDLMDEISRAAFLELSPLGKMPVLRDEARGRTVPESTIVIEYLDRFYLGSESLIPADSDLALQVRLADRFYDLYVHEPMQKIVLDRLRPDGAKDLYGVQAARAQLENSYAMIEKDMAGKRWAVGEAFSLADCAAMPALFYAAKVAPFAENHPETARYLDRLMERPSVVRVLREAQPYFGMFPAGQ
ncbi:glutathione S-transferase family protein [Mesorhizobium sp. 1B3]|uniref:glutathione S-transferase family protein n=1 Tax=Mesorhizobium sp. 1B3 TaxID=3243599 RepID=UPI003D95835C